jgi:cytochrome c553
MSLSTKCLVLVLLGCPVVAPAGSPAQQEFLDSIAAPPDAAHGRELFAHCSACHGPAANGTVEGAIPRIAGQHFQVLVRQLIHFRYGERWNTRMEDVAMDLHILADAQSIADVAWFVSRLDRGGPRGLGDGTGVDRGAASYAAQCASCHGAHGEGDGATWVPRIAGQHAGYLVRQINDAAEGRRPEMSAAHSKLFDRLDADEVRGLGDFLARVGWDASQK